MRLRELAWGLLAIAVLAGCSRLTFVKPNLKRHGYRSVAPEYDIRADSKASGRIAAMDHTALAEQALRNGQVDQAQTEAKAALKADAGFADAYTVLALVESQRGNPAEAGRNYARAVALEPTRGVLLNNYGAWLCANGRAAESLGQFDAALADPSYPTPAAALANAGSCALTAGQGGRAAANLQRALALDPGNPVALAAMAQSEYNAGHYFQARAFSERRLAAAPATVTVLQLASQIEQKLGDTAAAARYVQRIGAEFPEQGRDSRPGDTSQR